MSRFARLISSLLEKRVLLAGAVLTATLSASPEALAQSKKRGISGSDDATAGEQSEGIASGGLGQPGGSEAKQGPAPVPSFKMVPRRYKDAVIEAPAELVKGAPFNTKNYFGMPAENANAGPLVLDALTEFPANCGFRDISACPVCHTEVSRQNYQRIDSNLFHCPQCHSQVRLRFNEPMFLGDAMYNQPLVVVMQE